MKTTLNKIREHSPCTNGWVKLLRHLGKTQADDEPLTILTILNSNGLDDALWCLRAVDGYEKEMRLYAVWCVRQVQHLMKDPRSIAVLDVAERHAHGQASNEELAEARDAARDAAWDSAWASEGASASAAAWYAAWDAARAAAEGAAEGAAWAAQEAELRRVLTEIEAHDKMAENAKELELDYMEGGAEQYVKELEQQAPVRYQRIERGDGDWMDCTKEQYEKAMALPEWDTRVIATPQAQPASEPLTDEQQQKLRDAFAQALTSVYVCGRVWEAWRHGTMSEDDFQPASECEEVLGSLIEAAHGIKEKNT